jgi:hemolysin D
MISTLQIYARALRDLLHHYRRAWRAAWQARHLFPVDTYTRSEAAFLPSALALQETPLSPIPRWSMWALMTLIGLVVVWSIVGQVEIVATATGKIVPNQRSKIIQSLETAKVAQIHVHDGQVVQQGQALLTLDAGLTTADEARMKQELLAAQRQMIRASAVLAAVDQQRTPNVTAHVETIVDTINALLTQQTVADRDALPQLSPSDLVQLQAWAAAQYGEYRSKINKISSEIAHRQTELNSTQEMIGKLERTVPLAQERAKDFAGLLAQQYVPKHQYLEKEQFRHEQEADLATQRSRIHEIKAAQTEGIQQQAALTAEMRRTQLDQFNEGQQKLLTVWQEYRKAQVKQAQTQLTAPIAGTVQQLATHTVGGVVTPAQPLMTLVPLDEQLEIEAFLENKDMGFVKAGQDATIKLEPFTYTKYGTLNGTIVHVSQDAIVDERRNDASPDKKGGLIYAVRVKLPRRSLMIEGRETPLTAGMAATVEVKTGQRRVIEYFLSPLLQYQHESLRER